jgi:hypothetical protein
LLRRRLGDRLLNHFGYVFEHIVHEDEAALIQELPASLRVTVGGLG